MTILPRFFGVTLALFCGSGAVYADEYDQTIELFKHAGESAVFFTDCKEAFKEAVLRPGERVAVWDYENGTGPDSQKIAAQVEDEERYAAAEARDEGTMFHAGEEDLQAFWNLQREAPDLQKIATQAQHTMQPNQERERDNERHY